MKKILLTAIVLILFVCISSCEVDTDMPETEAITEEEDLSIANKDLSADGYVNFAHSATLKTFWMREDHEPWNRGKAEIYAFVIGLDRDKDPIIKTVPLHYADHDKTMYYPDQSLINWSNFYHSKVSVIFIEADDPHFTEHNAAWEFPIADGELKELSVEFALKYLIENFRLLGVIDHADDWVDYFENISRYQDYDVVGGKLDNVYITLMREY